MSKKNDKRNKLWKSRSEKGLCVYCGEAPCQSDRKGCGHCLAIKYKNQLTYTRNNSQRVRLYNLKIRWEVIKKYGGKCNCCGEDKFCFLVIDHKNNDGATERKTLYGSQSGSNNRWLLKLRREKIRDDLQILCWNCNAAKSIFGECPHKTGNFSPDFSSLEIDKRRQKGFGHGEKIKWPSDEELVSLVNDTNCSAAARKLGVHDTAVRGRLKRRGLYEKIKLRTGPNAKNR